MDASRRAGGRVIPDLLIKLIAVSVVCLFCSLALYGWGRLGEKILRARWPWPMTICLGLIAVIFIGGLLNLLHLAYAASLDGIVAIGALLAVLTGYADWKNRGIPDAGNGLTRDWFVSLLAGAILILCAVVFQATLLLPPAVFNVYDDFQTYLSLPLRMLATGTLQPGPFSYFGVNTLGAQSYLQGFVAAHWPLTHINAVDGLFGLALAGCLILVVGRRIGTPPWLGLLAVAALIAINPQYVNVSTLYIGSSLLIFLLLIPSGTCTSGQPVEPTSATYAVTTGMTYGALIALKSTFVLPVLVHFVLVAASSATGHRSLRRSVTWMLRVGLGSFVIALPWMLNQAPKLIPALLEVARLVGTGPSGLHSQGAAGKLEWLSGDPFIYGFGTGHIHYTGLAAVALLCALILLLRIPWQDRSALSHRLTAVTGCLALPVFYVIQMKTIGAKVMGADTALRYAAPVFIGLVPAAILLSGGLLTTNSGSGAVSLKRAPAAMVVLGLATVFVVAGFSVSMINRVEQAIKYRTGLSFLYFSRPEQIEGYIQYNRMTLSPFSERKFLDIQHKVPAGKAILSYVASSMHYDFSGNRILDVDIGGLGSAWLQFPLKGSADKIDTFLSARNIHYVLWEYRGYAVPTERMLGNTANFPSETDRQRARIRLTFNRSLAALSRHAEILHDDGTFRLIHIR